MPLISRIRRGANRVGNFIRGAVQSVRNRLTGARPRNTTYA
jgi:hypothetical protein